MSHVSVIIPTFNRLADLHAVLDALASQTLRDFEVLVVDNSSTDGTEAAMNARAAQVATFPLRYLRITPSGPAGARNAGVAVAAGRYVAFLDSDVILSPGWLERAVAELDRHPNLPAVGGVLLYANDRAHVNSYGGELSRIGLAWDALEGGPVERAATPADRLWINCSAMLARAQAVRAVGAFDGRFFYGFEDSDLGWRLAIAFGPLRVLPDLIALHNVGALIGPAAAQLVFHGAKNRLASFIANADRRMLAMRLPISLGYAFVDLLLRSPRRPKAEALIWNLRNLRGTLARRRLLAALRRRDAALDGLFATALFPAVRLNGMRRRPNRVQSVSAAAVADDRATP